MHRAFHQALLIACIGFGSLVFDSPAIAQRARLMQIERDLFDSDAKVRAQAALALARIGDRQSLAALLRALGDRHATVRLLAASALGRIGDRRAASPLALLRRDPDAQVRRQAARALAQIEGPRGDAVSAPGIPAVALRTMADGTRSVPGLGAALRQRWERELARNRALRLAQDSDRSAYGLSSTIVELSQQQRGAIFAVSCEVKLVLENSYGAIVMMASGAATVESARPSARQLQLMRVDALEAAVSSAGANLARYFGAVAQRP